MDNNTELTGKLVISGTLVYRDKDGIEVGRADFSGTLPTDEQATTTEGHDDDQRSE